MRASLLLLLCFVAGCTMFHVEGPAFSGLTTVNPPCVCPSPSGVKPSGAIGPQ